MANKHRLPTYKLREASHSDTEALIRLVRGWGAKSRNPRKDTLLATFEPDTLALFINNRWVFIFTKHEYTQQHNPLFLTAEQHIKPFISTKDEPIVIEKVIGCVIIRPIPEDKYNAWKLFSEDPADEFYFLDGFVLDPLYYRLGIGQSFLDQILERVHSNDELSVSHVQGRKWVVLGIWEEIPPLRKFYERCGMTLWGIFPEGHYFVAVYRALADSFF